MTMKRITIGAKPTLVSREATDIEPGAASPDAATPTESIPTPWPAATAEEWLRGAEAEPERQAEAASVTEPTAAAPLATKQPEPMADNVEEGVPPASGKTDAAPTPAAKPPIGTTLPPWAGIAGGAAAGAVFAVAVAWFMPLMMPMTDSRLVPLADRVTRIEGDMRVNGERMGKLNNEIAQTLDQQGEVSALLDGQAEEISAVKKLAAEKQVPVEPSFGPSSPVFAVALGQLRATFYSGRPFEAELMTVYSMAGNTAPFAEYLVELMGPARTGVPNAAELHRVFPAYAKAAGLQIGDPSGYYAYGLALVGRYAGFTTEAYSVEAANLAATRAEASLAAGHVGAAVAVLGELDPSATQVLEPWLDAARNFLRNEAAITEMTRVVVDQMREQGKELPAAPDADPAAPAAPTGGSLQLDAPETSAPEPNLTDPAIAPAPQATMP